MTKQLGKLLFLLACCQLTGTLAAQTASTASDEALLDRVQRETFEYFWTGGEPTSGAARERFHADGLYPHNDPDIVTSGGTGFGIMATIAAIERGFITRKEGRKRLEHLAGWLQQADRFHGAWAHWMHPSGRVKPFGRDDDGGDLVETAFLVQGLLVARQYFQNGNRKEQRLAALLDQLWKEVEWDWYTQGQNVLYWHWSPEHQWAKNFAVTGYNECTIMYILAAASPTHPVEAACYHEGYMRNGEIVSNESAYGYEVVLQHNGNGAIPVGPLFWAHYSFLGLDPRGLHDSYADYWLLNRNHALIHHAYCTDNPRGYRGYSSECWGLTASYSLTGYSAHDPANDLGVITPTAALSSFPYTPEESMQFLRHLYDDHPEYIGDFGPYDAFSVQSDWYLPRYLAIDQLPIPVMIENYRSGLIWDLFMSAPEIQEGLQKLGIEKQ